MRRLLCLAALAALTATAMAGCSSLTPQAASGGNGQLGKNGQLVIGYTAIGAAYSDLYVCEDAGVFKRNGLNVKLTTLNSSSQLLAALSSGSVQIGVGTATSTAVGILKGIKLKYIANPAQRYYLELWGKRSIGSPEQLAGHTIAVSSPGSLSDEAVKTMLKDRGLEGKVTIKYLKEIPAEVTALEHGAVDSIVTQPPNGTKTRKFGAHKIMDFKRYQGAANVYTVTDEFLKRNQPAVRAFVRSEVQCLSILQHDRKQTVASIRKHSGTDDQSLAEYSYNFFKPIWTRNPRVRPDLIRASFARAAAAQKSKAPADVSSAIDDSFIDSLRASGYLDSLYKK